MAILSKVEAKSIRGRLVHGVIILLLALGGITMIYPFLIMISGSLRSEMDAAELNLVPGFLVDDQDLYRKVLETKYSQNVVFLSQQHLRNYYSFASVPPPEAASEELVGALREYLARPELPRHWKVMGGTDFVDTIPANLRELRTRLKERFGDDLAEYARAAGSAPPSWLAITVHPPDWTSRRFNITEEPTWDAYFDMMEEAEPAELYLASVTAHFLDSLIFPVYGRADVAVYNRAHTVPLTNYDDFVLPQVVPGQDQPKLREEWITFVREVLNASFIVVRDTPPGEFQNFLRGKFESIADLNHDWQADYESFQDISLPDGGRWLQGPERRDYVAYLETLAPEQLALVGPDYDWPQWLAAQGLVSAPAQAPQIPMAQLEYDYALAHAGDLRWDYAVRNYVNVWEELVLEGQALLNTVIYCASAIAVALLINPLAAYGLSRYKLPGTYKFLLILMATMAFPPMVALLPQYILLRNMGLMNTFFALLLPLAANGYMIFLLKGFFDSLPQELYEAATIDGAGEFRMFFQITMALSKPILAVLALGTFTASYAAFLYPLLVAPDPDMWLIAVWLYQFQQRASSGAVFASVILASLPTLVIFLFVQRTIMRGIVVPTEK